jgi:hypothetical protein
MENVMRPRHPSRHRLHSGNSNVVYLTDYVEPEIVVCDTGALTSDGRKVGALEKRSPLPAGSYWFDAFGQNIPKANAWLKAFGPMGITESSTQAHDSDDPSAGQFYSFTYVPIPNMVVTWDKSLGWPTVSDKLVSSDDTVQRPDPELDPLDRLGNWLNETEQKLGGSIGSAAQVLPFALLLGAGYVIYKSGVFEMAIKAVKGKRKRVR